jgi:hypothetical protein
MGRSTQGGLKNINNNDDAGGGRGEGHDDNNGAGRGEVGWCSNNNNVPHAWEDNSRHCGGWGHRQVDGGADKSQGGAQEGARGERQGKGG